MFFRCSRPFFVFIVAVIATGALPARTQSSSSSSSKHVRKSPSGADSPLDAGTVDAGVYRNKGLGLSCKIPAGWVLRTEEMNAREEEASAAPAKDAENTSAKTGSPAAVKDGCSRTSGCGRVLLAAFSRPPEAAGEDVNSSVLIATESVSAYPGLKEAAQYFGPVTEVAKAQRFAVVNEPYEFVVGTKTLVRADFQKDVGSRVMRQSTLVMLARGDAVSITLLGGTEDEVEELVAGLSFVLSGKSRP